MEVRIDEFDVSGTGKQIDFVRASLATWVKTIPPGGRMTVSSGDQQFRGFPEEVVSFINFCRMQNMTVPPGYIMWGFDPKHTNLIARVGDRETKWNANYPLSRELQDVLRPRVRGLGIPDRVVRSLLSGNADFNSYPEKHPFLSTYAYKYAAYVDGMTIQYPVDPVRDNHARLLALILPDSLEVRNRWIVDKTLGVPPHVAQGWSERVIGTVTVKGLPEHLEYIVANLEFTSVVTPSGMAAVGDFTGTVGQVLAMVRKANGILQDADDPAVFQFSYDPLERKIVARKAGQTVWDRGIMKGPVSKDLKWMLELIYAQLGVPQRDVSLRLHFLPGNAQMTITYEEGLFVWKVGETQIWKHWKGSSISSERRPFIEALLGDLPGVYVLKAGDIRKLRDQ